MCKEKGKRRVGVMEKKHQRTLFLENNKKMERKLKTIENQAFANPLTIFQKICRNKIRKSCINSSMAFIHLQDNVRI